MAFRVLFAIRRGETTGPEEFARRWADHAELLARLPGLRAYTQCTVTGSSGLPGPAADGISIMDFDSEADFRRAEASPEMQAAHEDAVGFVGGVSTYHTRPRTVL